jgi:hypothetical protein
MATAAIRREKNIVRPNHQRTYLTPTGLLMEGVYTQNPRSEVNKCYHDFSTIRIESAIPIHRFTFAV